MIVSLGFSDGIEEYIGSIHKKFIIHAVLVSYAPATGKKGN
jgi:hypothetical protein